MKFKFAPEPGYKFSKCFSHLTVTLVLSDSKLSSRLCTWRALAQSRAAQHWNLHKTSAHHSDPCCVSAPTLFSSCLFVLSRLIKIGILLNLRIFDFLFFSDNFFSISFQILPQFVFNSRDPIVIGVIVEAGIVKEGTPICVPSKEVSDKLYMSRYIFFSFI